MGVVKNNMESNITPNITDMDPGGLYNSSQRHISAISTIKPNTNSGFEMTAEMTTYTLVIILLSVVVLLAITFVLFGLFMKAGAFTRSEPRVPTGRSHSFTKAGIDFETGEAAVFGPSGFGGFDE